ncbi:MAG: hypothetical protein EBV29_08345 [Gammaproteobacteria bacterium]|nr:hypothetical protein [Gammaproteobacteria bacterium]
MISGAGDLVKLGSGTLTLSGTNTFTGSTTISAGAIAVSADAGLGATSAEVLMNGGTLSATDSFTLDALRGVTLSTGATSTITVASTKTLLAAGVISGSGNLTKSGAGTITLTGANSFTGTFTVSVGAAIVGDGATSGSLATTSIVTNADLSFSRSDNVSSSAAITGTGGLTKLGNGTLTLTNTGTSYSGTTTISAGTLALGGSGVVGRRRQRSDVQPGELQRNGRFALHVTVGWNRRNLPRHRNPDHIDDCGFDIRWCRLGQWSARQTGKRSAHAVRCEYVFGRNDDQRGINSSCERHCARHHCRSDDGVQRCAASTVREYHEPRDDHWSGNRWIERRHLERQWCEHAFRRDHVDPIEQ